MFIPFEIARSGEHADLSTHSWPGVFQENREGAALNRSAGASRPSFCTIPASHMAALVLAIGLRILFVVAVGLPRMTPDLRSWPMDDDSHQYVRYAIDLMDGRQDEASVRMPLYPLLLAATWSQRTPWLLAILIQQLMGLAIGAACWLVAASCSRRAALPAGLAAMLLPQHVLYSTRIMPDTMALAAVACSGCLWLWTLSTRSPRAVTALYCLVGLVLSIGAMTKQVLLYSPIIYCVLLLFDKRLGPGVKLVSMASMLAAFLAMPVAWREFNRLRFGLDAYSTQDSFEPLGRVAILAGLTDQQNVWSGEFTASLDSLAMIDGRIDLGTRDSIYRARTCEIILSAPLRILLPHLVSWPRFFNLGYANLILRSMGTEEAGWPLLAWKLVLLVIYLLLAAGLIIAVFVARVRRRMKPVLLLLAGWSLFSVLVYGPLATTRYGLTFFWILTAGASAAFAILLEGRSGGPGSSISSGE